MKKTLSQMMRGMLVAALLCIANSAFAGGDYFYRTFHVVSQVPTGGGSVYYTTQSSTDHGEYVKVEDGLEDGFAVTLSAGYGRLFLYPTAAEGYTYEGVKVVTTLQTEAEPTAEELAAIEFATPMSFAEDGSYYEIMLFEGDATGDTDEEKGAWSDYGIYVGKDYDARDQTLLNENPDAYLYVYFKEEVTDGIKTVNTEETKTYYTIDGRQVSAPQNGLNIIRTSNGVKKVVK